MCMYVNHGLDLDSLVQVQNGIGLSWGPEIAHLDFSERKA